MDNENINSNLYVDTPYIPSRDPREINAVDRLEAIRNIPRTFVKDDDVQEGELNTAIKLSTPVIPGDYLTTSQVGAAGGVAPLNSQKVLDEDYLPSSTVLEVDLNGDPVSCEKHKVNIPLATKDTVGLVRSSDSVDSIRVNDDGTMSLNHISADKLVSSKDVTLVIRGGSAPTPEES